MGCPWCDVCGRVRALGHRHRLPSACVTLWALWGDGATMGRRGVMRCDVGGGVVWRVVCEVWCVLWCVVWCDAP